ncbi:UNVERIFIED_CONTAM: hypothetical protein GTU68_032221 [Idotea baltica]|nr:hypothetical protein [Idotea baltica]
MDTDNVNDKHSTVKSILVVDDSNTERKHLKILLESKGYIVSEAESGSVAIDQVAKEKPDLILLDIIMEGGDGYHTCRKLKRANDTRDISIIMISSKSNDVDKKWAMKLGALDYFSKPYDDQELLNRIGKIEP